MKLKATAIVPETVLLPRIGEYNYELVRCLLKHSVPPTYPKWAKLSAKWCKEYVGCTSAAPGIVMILRCSLILLLRYTRLGAGSSTAVKHCVVSGRDAHVIVGRRRLRGGRRCRHHLKSALRHAQPSLPLCFVGGLSVGDDGLSAIDVSGRAGLCTQRTTMRVVGRVLGLLSGCRLRLYTSPVLGRQSTARDQDQNRKQNRPHGRPFRADVSQIRLVALDRWSNEFFLWELRMIGNGWNDYALTKLQMAIGILVEGRGKTAERLNRATYPLVDLGRSWPQRKFMYPKDI